MDDLREKVIADLDELRIFADTGVHPIVSPDNWNVYAELRDMIDKAQDDAISLLKAQEPVSPKVDIDTYVCGACGTRLERQSLIGPNAILAETFNYCPNCGRKVKWE